MKNCANCGQAPPPVGKYLNTHLKLPLSVRLWMLRVKLMLELNLEYCPECGNLKLSVTRVSRV